MPGKLFTPLTKVINIFIIYFPFSLIKHNTWCLFRVRKFKKTQRLSSRDMKFLLILIIFLSNHQKFHICCYPIEEEISLGHSKNIPEMLNHGKSERHKPASYLNIYEEGIKEEFYPVPRNKSKIALEELLSFSRAEIEVITSEKLPNKVPHSMNQLATTSSPVTKIPHGIIYPGTKWCGSGDIAVSDDDLGTKEETDKCCRDHDHCDDYILPGETKYNLTNPSAQTSMSCECDYMFYDCLRRANTTAANSVGALFFNFGAKECFALDYPKRCKKTVPIFHFCYEYEVDTTAEKIYQWRPAKKYRKS